MYVHDENITKEGGEKLTVIQFAEQRRAGPKRNGDMNYFKDVGKLNLKWSVSTTKLLEYTQEFKEVNKQRVASNRPNKQSFSHIQDLNLVNQTKRHDIIHFEKKIRWVPWNSWRVNNTLGNDIEP